MMNKCAFGCGEIYGLQGAISVSSSSSMSRFPDLPESNLPTAASAQSVRLIMALSEAGSSLRCNLVSFVDLGSILSCVTHSF